jgi:translation initiation factor eIF-2B subunit delta
LIRERRGDKKRIIVPQPFLYTTQYLQSSNRLALQFIVSNPSISVTSMSGKKGNPAQQQNTDTSSSGASSSRPQLSKEEISAQRKAKAAEKQARKDAAMAKKDTEEDKSSAPTPSKQPQPQPQPQPQQQQQLLQQHQRSNKQQPRLSAATGSPQITSANHSSSPSPALSAASSSNSVPSFSLSGSNSTRRESLNVNLSAISTGKVPQPLSSTPHAQTDSRSSTIMQFDDPRRLKKFEKNRMLSRTELSAAKQVPLFSHLPQYERETSASLKVPFSSEEIHPEILKLGLQYSNGTITGSNARCIAMLNAFRAWISDYSPQYENKLIREDLLKKINPQIRFLIDCRPQSISMGNAVRWFKLRISRLPTQIGLEQTKALLINDIKNFITERITLAGDVIATYGASKIQDEDVILSYAYSSVVELVIKRAHDQGKQFRIIIVDSRPKNEGKKFLQRLVEYGINCSYSTINSLSYVMGSVKKVFLGASSLLSNGVMLSRIGSAVVCMQAYNHNIPVLVCCETYKFSDRVQLDSIGANELADPDDLITIETAAEDSKNKEILKDWRSVEKLKLLNLVYDLTPQQFMSMIITENGMVPPTSVPVILREYSKDSIDQTPFTNAEIESAMSNYQPNNTTNSSQQNTINSSNKST